MPLAPYRRRTLLAMLLAVALAGEAVAAPGSAQTTPPPACPALLQHHVNRLQDEKPQSLCQYAGSVVLVVNTASYCGFTGQYAALESLYARLRPRGFVVLGFPSNDFAQEKSRNADIAAFCENTYGVRFPMFVSSHVRGDQAAPFFRQLAQLSGTAPRWNFHKYLIARDGRLVGQYPSSTAPDAPALLKTIETLLAEPSPP